MSWPKARAGALRRDMGVCQYCLGEATTVDHVRPKHLGGTNRRDNLLAACFACNNAKGGMTLEEWAASGTAPSLVAWTAAYRTGGSGGGGPRKDRHERVDNAQRMLRREAPEGLGWHADKATRASRAYQDQADLTPSAPVSEG